MPAMVAAALAAVLAAPSAMAQGADEADVPSADAAPAETAGKLTRAPELLRFVEAPYPAEALEARLSGDVVLKLTIDADGSVSAVDVEQGAGHGFDDAAVEAARGFRFRPAEVDGKPAAVQILYRYAFTLEEQVQTGGASTAADGPVGVLSGELLERGTRAPLAGVAVELVEHGKTTVSDAQGHFSFDAVPAGEVTIVVRDAEFEEMRDSETVEADKATEVRYYLERSGFGDVVTVVGKRPRKEVVRRTLSVEEIRTIPGTSGDALKVVQNLPGAARIPYGFGALVLRGGGFTGAFADRHMIPKAFHFGGLRSTVNSALLESLDVYPGNYGPEFGRLNGGIVDLRLRRPREDGYHGFAGADVFDAEMLVEGPITDHLTFAVGGRRSYIDAILPLVLSDDEMDNFSTAPRYYDAQALLAYKEGRHDARLTVLGASDRMVLLIDEPAPGDPMFRGDFDLVSESLQTKAQWDFHVSERVDNHASVSHLIARERQEVGRDFSLVWSYHLATLREDVGIRLGDKLRLRGGADVQMLYVDYNVRAPESGPPREGDAGYQGAGQDFLHTEGTDLWTLPALWAEVDWRLGRLQLLPGLRADYYGSTEDVSVEPRLTGRYEVAKGSIAKAAVGLYSQSPDFAELERRFGNPDIGIEKSIQYSAGFEQRLTDALNLDAVGFYKDIRNMVTRDPDPRVRFDNDGQGRAYGLEMLLRHDLHQRLYGWLAYTLMRSERLDGPGEDWRVFDLDQTHNLVLVTQYKLSRTWEIGGRFRYVSGNPQTPYVGTHYDSDDDSYVPIAGPINSERVDAFHQLDLRVDKHWIYDTWRLTAYLDVQNVYNRQNPEGYTYNFDYTERKTMAGLPLIPSFGIRGEF